MQKILSCLNVLVLASTLLTDVVFAGGESFSEEFGSQALSPVSGVFTSPAISPSHAVEVNRSAIPQFRGTLYGLLARGGSTATPDDIVLTHYKPVYAEEFIEFRRLHYLGRRKTQVLHPYVLTREEMNTGYATNILPGYQTIILALQDKKIVGYVQANMQINLNIALLPEIAVDSHHEGIGLGTLLISEALNWLYENHRKKFTEIQAEDDSVNGQTGKILRRLRFLYFLGPRGKAMYRLPKHPRGPRPAAIPRGVQKDNPWQTLDDIETMAVEPAWLQNLTPSVFLDILKLQKTEILKLPQRDEGSLPSAEENNIYELFQRFMVRAVFNGALADYAYQINWRKYETFLHQGRSVSSALLMERFNGFTALAIRGHSDAIVALREYSALASYASKTLAEIRQFSAQSATNYPWDINKAFDWLESLSDFEAKPNGVRLTQTQL